MTQLAQKYHTKMKSLNRRRRCSCCSPLEQQRSTTTTAKSNAHTNGEQMFESDIPHCYDVATDTNMTSRIRPRRNEKTTKPLLHTMMIIMMMTWATTQQRLPQQCASFTIVLLKYPIHRPTFSRLSAVVPSLPSENSKKARSSTSSMKRKVSTKKTSTASTVRRQTETTVAATSSPTSAVTETLTENEMKRSMLSTKKRDIRKKLILQQDYQLEASMLTHDLLTKEQEYELVYIYRTAKELQIRINNMLLEKQKQQQLELDNINERGNFVLNELGMNDFDSGDDDDDETDDFDELYTSLLRSKGGRNTRKKTSTSANTYSDYMENQQQGQLGGDDDNENDYFTSSKRQLILERLDLSSRATMASLLLDDVMNNATTKIKNSGYDSDDDATMEAEVNFDNLSTVYTKWRDVDHNSSAFSVANLSDNDIVELLHIPGGRQEMEYILLMGAQARDTLIRSNFRLVASICKKWARMWNGEGKTYIYGESWDRPSLSEAIQEGVIGLTTAVERFDPARGLRLTTYATFWITNSVRQCFQRFSTGCLKVPTGYYEIYRRFKALVRKHNEMDGFVPSIDVLAEEMGLTERRLSSILRLTKPLLSIDGALLPTGAMTQAGKAGNINRIEDGMLLSDTLADSIEFSTNPIDHVELSFLRQQLEHAMAAELVPFERDVLRLRLGLDDGVTRTPLEVALVCGGRLKSSEIRTIERRALKKLRSPVALATYKLLTFLDFADVDIKTITLT